MPSSKKTVFHKTVFHLAFLLLAGSFFAPRVPAQSDPASSAPVEERLRLTVEKLSAPDMDGRGPGTAGLEKARDWIRDSLRDLHLRGGSERSFFQTFTPQPAEIRGDFRLPEGAEWGKIPFSNVVGVVPGTGNDKSCVVVCAHYDHLGRNADGAIFPGADDNASGVAVLLEVAAQVAAEGPFRNPVVFVALSAEEEGTLGARYFVANSICPADRIVAVLNLDTVGRMEGSKLFVFGAATAAEFPEILKGVGMGSGLDLVTPDAAPFGSDQVPFLEKGIPGLHLFTGPNVDYHRPTDTPEKLNYAAMAKVVNFAREMTIFLAGRSERLTFVPPGAGADKPIVATGPPRRTSLGTIPDFGRESGGVLITGTTPGSPAEHAGMIKGDVIVSIGGTPVDNLGDLSTVLKAHQPGDTVEVVFKRGSEEMTRRIGLVERK